MVMIAPRLLNFDISFQLSLFATFSLVIFQSKIAERVGDVGSEFIKEGILVTLSAQLMTLPISFYNFGSISIIAPISNLLILPLVPPLMALSMGSLVLSVFSFEVGKWSGGLTWAIVELMVRAVDIIAKIPLASITLGKGMIWLAMLYYLLVYWFYRRLFREGN